MAVYFLCDVVDRIVEIMNDGILFADIRELTDDNDSPACLLFSASDSNNELFGINYEPIDSTSENAPCTVETNKACFAFSFEFDYRVRQPPKYERNEFSICLDI